MRDSRLFFAKIGFGISLILLIYFCCIGIKNVFRYNVFKEANKDVLSYIDFQERLHHQFKKEILALNNERYLELIAKEKLQLIKPGEKMYKFIESP